MKNFFLSATTALFFIVSCSSDQNETSVNDSNQTLASSQFQKSGQVINVALKEAYEDMLISQSYIAFESSITDFSDKLAYDGDMSDIDTETKMLNWISNNIGKTKFLDYNEAETLWGVAVQKSIEVYDLNPTFFSEFNKSKSGDLTLIMTPEIDYVGQACSDDCFSSYLTCNIAVLAAYEAQMKASEGTIQGPILMALAKLSRSAGITACIGTLGLCLDNCE